MTKETKAKDCCYGVRPLSDCQCEKDRLAALAATPAVGGERLADKLDAHAIRYANDYGYGIATDLKEAAAALRAAQPASPLRGTLELIKRLVDNQIMTDAEILGDIKVEVYEALSALPPEQPAAAPLPSIDQVRQTVADEWGSYVCYRTMVGVRDCDQDKHCRCADIARAILSTYTLTPQPAAEPFQPHENCDCLMCLAEKPR